MSLLSLIPLPSRIVIFVVAGVTLYMLGMLHGERVAGQAHIDYISAQAAQSVKVAQAQAKIVIDTQIKYVPRIKTIYTKGEAIEKQVPIYITSDDNAGCAINAGFVRIHDAAWSGEPAGPATSADREPAGVPLAAVAETTAFNATACLAWREQALTLRELYTKLQAVMK